MPERRTVLLSLAAMLVPLGAFLLAFRATERGDLCWWTDPIFWIGAVSLAAGAALFLWLLVPPWLTDRQARRARAEQHAREGRANQRQGLDEILLELGQISNQLKAELRWGKQGTLFPNTAWAKNRHLVTGETQALVEAAHEQAHQLDLLALAATSDEMDAEETAQRQQAKQTVDAAAEAVRNLRDAVQP